MDLFDTPARLRTPTLPLPTLTAFAGDKNFISLTNYGYFARFIKQWPILKSLSPTDAIAGDEFHHGLENTTLYHLFRGIYLTIFHNGRHLRTLRLSDRIDPVELLHVIGQRLGEKAIFILAGSRSSRLNESHFDGIAFEIDCALCEIIKTYLQQGSLFDFVALPRFGDSHQTNSACHGREY